jgi:hypothetical protein
MRFDFKNRMIKKTHAILRILTILFDTIPVMRDTVSFCNILCKKVIFRICKSVLQQFSGKILFKAANNIWVLGKNNLDKQEYLPVTSDTGKYSKLRFRIAAKTEAVLLWR